MTPTEQDKELREKIHMHIVSCEQDGYGMAAGYKSTNGKRYSSRIDLHTDSIMQLITADRKRVALEEREKARKFYAKRKPQFTKTWVADVLGISRPTLNKWMEDPEQFTIGAIMKLAELKAQQEEV